MSSIEELQLSLQQCRAQVMVMDAMIAADPGNADLRVLKAQLYVGVWWALSCTSCVQCDCFDTASPLQVFWIFVAARAATGSVGTIGLLEEGLASLAAPPPSSTAPEAASAAAPPPEPTLQSSSSVPSTWSVGETCLVLTYPDRKLVC